jgi:hypothetical protein
MVMYRALDENGQRESERRTFSKQYQQSLMLKVTGAQAAVCWPSIIRSTTDKRRRGTPCCYDDTVRGSTASFRFPDTMNSRRA